MSLELPQKWIRFKKLKDIGDTSLRQARSLPVLPSPQRLHAPDGWPPLPRVMTC